MVSGMDPVNESDVRNGAADAQTTLPHARDARQSPKFNQVLLQRNSTSPSVPRKIMSKNHNNTIFPTSYPSNLAELQLFRVMQNASLLVYYDTLLEMGGDDVQQLCDACEEEFLEIMSLVGMASKPLHVRRLQKSLHEWVGNPSKFKLPLVPGDDYELELSSPRVTSNHGFYTMDNTDSTRTIYSPSPGDVCALPSVASPGLSLNKRPYSPLDTACPPSSSSSPGSCMSVQLTPSLMESQISKLAAAAERLSRNLPQYEPKPHNTKKKVCKELELVMSMPENDPRRMDEIRRYAAIYGRFDCKRKPEKPLTLHEVSVNEAAAQICRFIPALLTRRDELFPLARQVVKDSGCYYSKTQLSTMYMNKHLNHEEMDNSNSRDSPRIHDGEMPSKKAKLDLVEGDDRRQESEDGILIRTSLHSLFQHHSRNTSHSYRESNTRKASMIVDIEDADSRYSYSNCSSPQRKIEDDEDLEDSNKYSPKVQVIAASGDNIIAVANPALAMSTAIITPIPECRETAIIKKE
ncbi:NGFI-A-binding protein homolog [Harmonia axyridis]|uniref:NGFI-A-binding protein homolog n=1 Tax=Harmonia axyridis TaxID=115357 RepID=UPI001E275CAB|nr:NGFI-A-binding protein homolog [Harmonia axyridis]